MQYPLPTQPPLHIPTEVERLRHEVAALDRRRLQVRPLKGSPIRRTVVVVVARDRYVPRPAQALLELVAESV